MEKLIRDSQMDESEKAMWLELLPTMKESQKSWLRDNLEYENKAIAQLERKYGKIMMDEEKVRLRKKWITFLEALDCEDSMEMLESLNKQELTA